MRALLAALLAVVVVTTAAPIQLWAQVPPVPAPDGDPADADDADDADDAADTDDADDAEEATGAPDTGYIGKNVLSLAIDDCPVRPDVSADDLLDLAFEKYERATVLYDERGDYHAAIREFVASYCLVPHHKTLKNIAQAYERLLSFELAIAYLERFVRAVPDSEPNAAEQRRSTSARAQVLRKLPASVQVATNPPRASVWLTDEFGVRRNAGRADGEPFLVAAGAYTMTVELSGYETLEREIEVAIGKPYSLYLPLVARSGRLSVTAVPGDARIFVDQRLVGIGRYDDKLPRGTYQLSVEAPGRVTETRGVEVVADRNTDLAVRLPARPASGRRQLIVAGGIAGAAVGSVAFGVLDSQSEGFLAFVGGAGLGVLGGIYGIPEDVTVGTSSYIVTAGLVGAMEAGLVSSLFLDSSTGAEDTIGPVAVGGMTAGALFAALTSDRFNFEAGDAGLLTSGALWGTIGGGLLTVIFEGKARVSQALVLGGLNLGVVSGVLIGRNADVSRGHVALIDLAGLAGMGIAVSIQAAIDDVRNQGETSTERTSHFALAGMTAGLFAGAFLTRNMDVPKVGHFAPVIGTPQGGGTGMIIGLSSRL